MLQLNQRGISMDQATLKQLLSYDNDTGLFTWIAKPNRNIRVGSLAGTVRKNGYLQIRLNKQSYLAHRLAWLYIYGKFPTMCLDHINGDKQDNRLCNLRTVTVAENRQNQHSAQINSKTGILGVCIFRGRYRASIYENKRYKWLGDYDSPEEAKRVYNTARKVYYPHTNTQSAGY